jgi:hypothetical protein
MRLVALYKYRLIQPREKQMDYETVNGEKKTLGEFGRSTQREFDGALASLPGLISQARQGDEEAGRAANDILWGLANESVNTRKISMDVFQVIHQFGNPDDRILATMESQVWSSSGDNISIQLTNWDHGKSGLKYWKKDSGFTTVIGMEEAEAISNAMAYFKNTGVVK